jgi:prophage regulatory protein
MENRNNEQPPKTILRQVEVLRRTGFSRSTLYLRIGKGEFPRQVALGARAVGWVQEEVDAWIAKRMRDRPQSGPADSTWEQEAVVSMPENRFPARGTSAKETDGRAPETATPKDSRHRPMPDLAQLELIGTNVYVEKKTGALWFQVLRPNQTRGCCC